MRLALRAVMPRAAPQITYAAHDAWLSRELLLELHRRYNKDRGQQQHQQHQQQQQQGADAGLSPSAFLEAGATAAPESASGAGAPGTPGGSQSAPAPGGDIGAGRGVSPGRHVSVLDLVAPFLDTFGGIKTKRVDRALGPAAGAAAAAAAAAAADAAVRLRAAVGNAPSALGDGGGGDGSVGGGSSSVSLSGGGGANGRNKAGRKLPTRKSVLYENCRLLVRVRSARGLPVWHVRYNTCTRY